MDGQQLLLDRMRRMNIPVTRENYIEMNWDPLPDEWSMELEAELPEELQDMSLFDRLGNFIGDYP